jgi:zinc protease
VVALRTGSVADPTGKDGLFRLMVRMLRRGSSGLSAVEVENAIDQLGGELGLDVSPSTASLHGQVIRRNLRPFCELLATIVGKPTFAEDEFLRLRRESIAEIYDARDNDRALASLAFRRALFADHPYARSASGRPSSLEKLTRNDVVSAYHRHFVRADCVIGFAGAITETEAHELGALLAGALHERGNGYDGPAQPVDIPEPAPPADRSLIFVDKPERTQTQVLIGTLGTFPHDADHFPLVCATAILGGTFTSRMMSEIRSKRGWSYGTSARLTIDRRRHAFVMSAFPASNDCAPCISLELSMLEQFVQGGVSQREISFIKNYIVRSHAFDIDTAPKRLGPALDSELLALPADYYTHYLDHVRAVTPTTASAAIAARISPDNLVVVVVGTASALVDQVTAAIPRLARHEVIPFDRE